jgi:protein TonB
MLQPTQITPRIGQGNDDTRASLFVDSLSEESDASTLDENLQTPPDSALAIDPNISVADIATAQPQSHDTPIANIVTTLGAAALSPIAAPPATIKRSGKKSVATSARGGGRSGIAGTGAGGIYIPAKYARCPAPAFPPEAKKSGLKGTVFLLVEVDEEGRPASVCIRRTSGYEMLDTAALRTVRNWRFEPARLDGQAVTSRAEVPVRFAS